MLRCALFVGILGTLSLSAAPAHAQWMSKFMDSVHRDYHRNVEWPETFLRADREAVNMPFGLMVANGWRRQNLLSDYHFNEDNPQLNLAGEMKLNYILTQMPPNRRTIFVQRGATTDVTASRVAVVHRAASKMLPRGAIAEIAESDLPNDGWPADEIDAIGRKFQSTRPDPRLKSASSGGDSGGGQGSGNAN